MVRKGTVLFVTVETPLHAGTGAELGIVDLPIQRERHTGWPKVEASGIKGALRENINLVDKLKNYIFGPEDGELHSSALVLTDLRVLLFPVKSAKGTFAWTISPEVYKRFRKDIFAVATMDMDLKPILDKLPESLNENTVTAESTLTVPIDREDFVLLEEFSFPVSKGDSNLSMFTSWLKESVFTTDNPRYDDITERICVVEDDLFNDFVRMYTEIITRTRIDTTTGTVQPGALWNEEYLPAETVMYCLMMSTPIMSENKDQLKEIADENPEIEADNVLKEVVRSLPTYLFLGGNETIGKGLVSLKVVMEQEV